MNITTISDIKQIITQKLEQFKQIYLVIDPNIDDLFLFNYQDKVDAVVPIRDRQDAVLADDECIQLCMLNRENLPPLNRIINELEDENSSVIAMLFSTYAIDEIQKEMSNAMRLEYQGDRYLFRYYDPKVLRHLTTIFKPEQLNPLLGVIEYWYYWDDNFVELHHKPDRVLADIDYKMSIEQWHKLTAAQDYNYYESVIEESQNNPLSLDQKQKLTTLFNWIYFNPYYESDKNRVDEIINFALTNWQLFWDRANQDLIKEMIYNRDNNIKHYFMPPEGE